MKTGALGGRRAPAVTALAFGIGIVSATAGGAATWSVEIEPTYFEVGGHDPHVATLERSGGTRALELETEAALGYRASLLHERGRWDYGLDFFIHRTDQAADLVREAASGPADRRMLAVPNRTFVSTSPGEVLYFQRLEDTTVELWVLDLYARRAFEGDDGPWSFLLGVRNADFDNDHRAIAGIDGVRGTRIDASSNYSRMIGPLLGVAATVERGRHTLHADLRQSVVFGDLELERTLRDFTGPPGPFAGPPEEVPAGLAEERLAATDSVTVPMTDLALRWRWRLGEHWTLGASLGATAWWDLPVPPGVNPTRPESREETTLVTYGLGATVGFRF